MYTCAPIVPAGGVAFDEVMGMSAVRQLALLAPTPEVFPPNFQRVAVDAAHYTDLLGQMQRLRGSVALQEGAIRESDLDDTGRHVMAVDNGSFHLLALSPRGQVLGCCRFNPHQPTVAFEDLTVSKASIVSDPILGPVFRQAVGAHLRSARERGYLYVEVGGWALHPSIRFSTEAVRIALLNYSLGQALGGALGICTATTRNHSAAILRRIGGRPLNIQGNPVPQYFDTRYGCDIEVVTFDSDLIPDRHDARVRSLMDTLNGTPVVCYQSVATASLCSLLRSIGGTPVRPLEYAFS
jgi:hypothetical protein